MDRQYQLIFCQKCNHKKFDPKRGIVCGLTNDIAKFHDTCKDFSGNEKEVLKEIQDEEARKAEIQELLTQVEADENGSQVWTIIKIIIGILVAIAGFLAA